MPISIVVPAYNAAETIAEAGESVLAQTMPEWEMIAILLLGLALPFDPLGGERLGGEGTSVSVAALTPWQGDKQIAPQPEPLGLM